MHSRTSRRLTTSHKRDLAPKLAWETRAIADQISIAVQPGSIKGEMRPRP